MGQVSQLLRNSGPHSEMTLNRPPDRRPRRRLWCITGPASAPVAQRYAHGAGAVPTHLGQAWKSRRKVAAVG